MVNDPNTFNELIDALKAKLEGLDSRITVHTEPGGPSPWSLNGDVDQFLFAVEVIGCKQTQDTIPGSRHQFGVKREPVFMVDGWYPAVRDGSSATAWVEMLDEVVSEIESNPTLGLRVPYAGKPYVAVDDYQLRTSPHRGDQPILCHYCRIAVPVLDFYDLRFE